MRSAREFWGSRAGSARSHSPKLNTAMLAGVALAMSLALATVYASAIGFDFVAFDDSVHITGNPMVQQGLTGSSIAWAFGGSYAGYWIPLTWLSHMLDVELFGLAAGGHHATNLVLHLFNALLFFGVLVRLTGVVWASAIAAALFALHPLRVESVVWVTERKDVLSSAFGLLATLAYISYTRRRRAYVYGLCALMLTASLMAKPMLVTFPILLLLIDYWPLGRMTTWARLRPLIVEKLPLIAIVLVFAAVTYVVQGAANAASDVGPRVTGEVPLPLRIGNAIGTTALYVKKVFWPGDLAVFYPHPNLPGGEPWSAWEITGSLVLLGVITLGVLRLAPSRGYAAVGWFAYLVTLVPVIGLVQTGEQGMADRFTYVPMMGLCLAISFGAMELLERLVATSRARTLVGTGLALVVLAHLGWKSHQEAQHWRDTDALYQRALEVAPPNPMIRTYYANWLYRNGRVDEAIVHHRAATSVPGYEAVAHYNLAVMLVQHGDRAGAFEHYRAVLREAPDFVPARMAVAGQLEQDGRYRAAARHYALAQQLVPESPVPVIGLARALARQPGASSEDRLRAVKLAKRGVRLTGKRSADALEALAVALQAAGHPDRAAGAMREAEVIRANATSDGIVPVVSSPR
jgi:Flp pilus assembly protein TadD